MAFGFTRQRKSDIDTRLEALRGELNALQQDMKGLVGDVGAAADERIMGAVRAVEAVARQSLHLAEETVAGTVEDMEDWADERVNAFRGSIRKRPLYALVLAVGAGAIIGASCQRR